MLRILTACAFVVAVGILVAFLKPQPALSDAGLTSLVNSAYFPRTEDPALHELAHLRAAQIAQDFSHDGMVTAEVLAWNQGYADPVAQAVSQWQGSPDHDAILSDPSLTLIGCGSVTTPDGRYFAVCTLSGGSPDPAGEPVEVARTPNPQPVGSIPTAGASPPALIPNTALEAP